MIHLKVIQSTCYDTRVGGYRPVGMTVGTCVDSQYCCGPCWRTELTSSGGDPSLLHTPTDITALDPGSFHANSTKLEICPGGHL